MQLNITGHSSEVVDTKLQRLPLAGNQHPSDRPAGGGCLHGERDANVLG